MNRRVIAVLAATALALGGCGSSEEPAAAPAEAVESAQEPIDSDGDGVLDDEDDFPNNPDAFDEKDRDGDGVNNGIDYDPDDPDVLEAPDSDGDGVPDDRDDFPKNPNRDTDSDGDGVADQDDYAPNDPKVTKPPKPVEYSGQGDTVLKVEKPSDIMVGTFTYQGSSNFIVASLDSNLDRIDGLVNTIGTYSGTVLMDVGQGEQTTALEIQTDGPWTVKLEDWQTAETFSKKTEGAGDDVRIFDGQPGIANIKHQGDSNFIVRIYSSDGSDGLVNEIGNYQGTVPLRTDFGIVTIQSEGTWSINVG